MENANGTGGAVDGVDVDLLARFCVSDSFQNHLRHLKTRPQITVFCAIIHKKVCFCAIVPLWYNI
jgi:hypothetical protein